MKTRSILLPLALALALLPAGGCATGSGGADAAGRPEDQATLTVENDLAVPSEVTVYLQPVAGGRRLVGTLGPGRTETLRLNAGNLVGPVHLVARLPLGRQVVSQQLTISRGEQLQWNLRSNIVRNQ